MSACVFDATPDTASNESGPCEVESVGNVLNFIGHRLLEAQCHCIFVLFWFAHFLVGIS